VNYKKRHVKDGSRNTHVLNGTNIERLTASSRLCFNFDQLQCVLNVRLVAGTQVRPRLVTLAARGIALARRPRTYPLQTGSHSASLSAVQGSCVPGRLL